MNLIKKKTKTKKPHFPYVGISGGVGLLHAYMRRDSLDVICPPCFLQTSLSTGITSLGTPAKIFFNITYHLIQKWLITILVSLGTTCSPIVFNAIPQQPLCYQSNFILFIQYEYNVWSYWIIHKIHWVYSLDTWSWLITWLDVDLTDRIEYPMYFFLKVILFITVTYVWIRDNPY